MPLDRVERITGCSRMKVCFVAGGGRLCRCSRMGPFSGSGCRGGLNSVRFSALMEGSNCLRGIFMGSGRFCLVEGNSLRGASVSRCYLFRGVYNCGISALFPFTNRAYCLHISRGGGFFGCACSDV